MSTVQSQVPRIVELADRLERDIRTRALQPGDPYLTTTAASQMLGVANSMANRALQLLEKRRVISRQQRRGAVVMQPKADDDERRIAHLHLLVHQQYLRTEGVGNDGVLLGMQEQLPGTTASITFLPVEDEAAFVEKLIERSFANDEVDAFVLVRASYETQRLMEASSLPAVVLGTLYPSIERLSVIDRDFHQSGEVLAGYLKQRYGSRAAYFGRQHVYPGDHLTIDTLSRRFRGFLVMRHLPNATAVITRSAADLLAGERPPQAFICQTERIALGVEQAVHDAGLRPQQDIGICVCDYYLKPGQIARFPYARPTLSAEQIGVEIGRILKQQAGGELEAPVRRLVPIELELLNS